MPSASTHLHGWGYEGRIVDDLVRFAWSRGATTVADVRLNPVSRRRGFSKRLLAEALAEAGIAYVHLPTLGNPRDNREGFADPRSPVGRTAHSRFVDEVLSQDEAHAALHELVALAEQSDVVVLCYEADQASCHRDLVIQAAVELQRSVVG